MRIPMTIGAEVATRYKTLVPKGARGVVTNWVLQEEIRTTLIRVEFLNGESFWFMQRDLREV